MLKAEKNYAFRTRLLQVNKPGQNDGEPRKEGELALRSGCAVQIPESDVIYTAARDFQDFLYTSMDVSASLKKTGEAEITVTVDSSYKSYKCYKIEIADSVQITAHDDRGAAQALFHLEEMMGTRHGPYLKQGVVEREPLYSPRMTHSGYGIDMFPDEHLLQIAKAGMDAIMVFTTDVNWTQHLFLDFNELIYRAAKHGLDVYMYSYMGVGEYPTEAYHTHPDDPNAYSLFDQGYGEIFRQCPGLKGVILVGESIPFNTKDPRACTGYDRGIPDKRPHVFMWPCMDYVQYVELVRDVIRKERPDADIIFWSYNWATAPEKDRLQLLEALPTDITLLVTFEAGHRYWKDGIVQYVHDYTLSFAGPSHCFTSEAEVAHRRGIRLYAMANTAGTTWDFGTIPYLPMPYQWIARYKGMREAHDNWGLCGLMECHHMGFWPSFVSQLARQAFEKGAPSYEEILHDVLVRYYGKHADLCDRALKLWSQAITYHVPTLESQRGAFGCGPVYPFNLNATLEAPLMRHSDGNFSKYHYPMNNSGEASLSFMRIQQEIESLEMMRRLFEEGVEVLKTAEDPNEELEYLIYLGRFLACYARTGVGARKWRQVVARLKTGVDPDDIEKAIAEAEVLLEKERCNVLEAIEVVTVDSRLGWEPRMEYRNAPDQLDWKLRQLAYVRDVELSGYRSALRAESEDYDSIIRTCPAAY